MLGCQTDGNPTYEARFVWGPEAYERVGRSSKAYSAITRAMAEYALLLRPTCYRLICADDEGAG